MSDHPTRFDIDVRLVDPDRAEATWRPTGREMGPAREVPGFVTLETLAQVAGRTLAVREADGARWLLAGVDDAVTSPVTPGRALTIVATVGHVGASAATVDVVASIDGEVVAHAALMMVRTTFPA